MYLLCTSGLMIMNKIIRRDFLKMAIGDFATDAVKLFENAHKPTHPRPPGALAETIFLATCIRCGKCAEACSAKCISHNCQASKGITLGTPYMNYKLKGCNLCLKCIDACPTGALSENKTGLYHIGTAKIFCKTCIAWNGAICMNCTLACKRRAITLNKGRYPLVQKDLCIGCGECQTKCIVSPRAIVIEIPDTE